jgi:hypothetical protein
MSGKSHSVNSLTELFASFPTYFDYQDHISIAKHVLVLNAINGRNPRLAAILKQISGHNQPDEVEWKVYADEG